MVATPWMIRLGQFVFSVRLLLGLTQAEAARRFAVSSSYISNIERGKALPTSWFLRRLTDEVCRKQGIVLETRPVNLADMLQGGS